MPSRVNVFMSHSARLLPAAPGRSEQILERQLEPRQHLAAVQRAGLVEVFELLWRCVDLRGLGARIDDPGELATHIEQLLEFPFDLGAGIRWAENLDD